eukprot:ctg_1327.g430
MVAEDIDPLSAVALCGTPRRVHA